MKRFTLRGVLDGIRSTVSAPSRNDTEIEETLRSDHFHICKTVKHGFPHLPTAVAFDPVQRILAIGNKTGSLRIIGRPGVDVHVMHDEEVEILQVIFLVNEGALITACSDNTLHLWNYRQKRPEIVQSLKFQRERITFCHLPFQSKWLYVGTVRGNVHIVGIESFVISGYVINWNKAIEISRKTHPGPVVHLSDCPVDSNKLLIGFESGVVVLWDLKSKLAECRFNCPEALGGAAWQHDGRQFMCSHSDGSLTTWSVKLPQKAQGVVMPHAKMDADLKTEPCKPISKLNWKSIRNAEDMIIFSGGLPYNNLAKCPPSITIINGRSTTVLEMEGTVVDFVVLCETPWRHDFQDPYAIVVLLQNDLVIVDLTSSGFPCFENPYPMDLHESPVTACQYYANCPTNLIPAFYCVGSRQKKTGFSEKEWPIKGGQWGATTVSYPEIMITGHADGSLKFWDASSVSLQVLYKLKTSKVFEKPKHSSDKQDDVPFAVQLIHLCLESRLLLLAGASHIVLCRFCKQEQTQSVTCLEFSVAYEICDDLDMCELECPSLSPKPNLAVSCQMSDSVGSHSSNMSDNAAKANPVTAVRVRGGMRKWPAGYRPDLVCALCYVDGEMPDNITIMAVSSSCGLMAFGTECGLAIVDIVQKVCLLNLGTPDLYGSMDPYQRAPRSPRSRRNHAEGWNQTSDDGKSPTTDQDRTEGSPVSRSRSSSISSLDSITKESVHCLVFFDSYPRKSDHFIGPCLWVGTGLGSVIVINLDIPCLAGDQRANQPVIVSPSGTIFRTRGGVVGLWFLGCNGISISNLLDQWRDACSNVLPGGSGTSIPTSCNRDGRERDAREDKWLLKTPRQASVSTSKPRILPPSSQENSDRQFVVICSEKQAKVISLPSHMCAHEVRISETSVVVRAEVVSICGGVCLMVCVANGHIVAFSLPSLKPLFDDVFLPLMDCRVVGTFCLSNSGHALYLCSPFEVQKMTYSADIAESLTEMMGDLFLPCDMPEAPKQSFFKNLFGGGTQNLDRHELFGEAVSGKAASGLAKHVHTQRGSDGLYHALPSSGEMSRTRMLVSERGEKVSELDDSSARMLNQAEGYAQAAHQAMLKCKDKKWYKL